MNAFVVSSLKLARPIELKDGGRLQTLADARQFMVRLTEGDQLRNAWQKAAELLMAHVRRSNLSPAN
jgi:hypothetical protein